MTQEMVIKQSRIMPLFTVTKRISIMISLCLLVNSFTAKSQTIINQCWETSSCNPELSWATSRVTINPAANELTIRVTYGKTLNDATYGTNKSVSSHSNKDLKALLNSDMVELKVYNSSNQLMLFFRLDQLDRTGSAVPYNYFAAGIGGDAGALYTGTASDFISFKTSIAENLQTYYASDPNYFESTSPLTDQFYSINTQYPLWDFNIWYEVTMKLSSVGSFGSVDITDMHISPPSNGTCQSVNPFPVNCHNELGNLVWNDLNRNGVKNFGEPGIAGVSVRLYEDYNNDNVPDGAFIASTTTNASGNYLFSGLKPGNYIVSILKSTLTAGAEIVNNGTDPDDDLDNDNNGLTGVPSDNEIFTKAVTLTPYSEPDVSIDGDGVDGNLTVDFGIVINIVGSIGDRVWVDNDKDGLQDAGEVGLAGVTVTLYDNSNNVISSTITDAYGNYKFSNLPTSTAGTNYQVRFSLVPGYQFSPNNGAVSVTDNSDAVITTGRTSNVTLTNANPGVTYVDAGMYYTASARLGDFVWNDLNKNGLQESGEPGIAGVTVMLYTAANVLYRSTVTSNNGYYFFNDVAPGNYYVKVALPIGYQVSPKDAGADNIDSDIDPVTMKTPNFAVVAGTNNLTLDAGLNVTTTTGASASLGDKVWEDLNSNSIQDAGEPGIANVMVQLFNSTNVLQATVTSDAFGNYIFNAITPGSYYVKFTLPSGFSYVTANTGADDNIDSDVDGTGTSQTVTLIADEINTSVDAGMRRTTVGTALGDFVWYDLNKNGTQDGGAEVGVPGITVVLYSSTNTVVATTTTNANGFYLFTGLPASTTYTVGFENIPAGFGFSPYIGAVAVTTNSDVVPTTGRTGNVTTGAAGTTVNYVDAGLISTPNTFDSKSSIGDKVWNDLNNNGIQDAAEPGIASVTVTLYAANGTTVIATTVTDALGNYLFTNLDAGSYVIGFSGLPAGYVFATKDAGTDDTKDSDADGTTGKTAPISLAAGEINLSIDAGARNTITTLSSLGNFVWFDVNSNGIQDAGEPGAAGISVALKNALGIVIKTTNTSSTGFYLFTDLAAGTYTIQFGNLPAGYVATTKNAAGSTAANNSDADATTLSTDNIVLAASTTDLNWDMGIKTTTRGSLGDFVWNDVNGNGIQDAGEPGIAGVTVTLYDNANNPVATTITNANGFYTFSNLLAGTYSVGFSTIPATSTFTTQNAAGSTAANNSDVDPATTRTATFTLAAGQSKTDIDAGLVSYKAAVGDYVWHDVNRNGLQDSGEPGVAGVTATMYKSTNATIGDGDDVAVASAVTNANGYYFINNVPVASTGSQFYMRYTDVQTGYTAFTIPLVGGTGASNNSKVALQDITNGRTGFFTLNPNQVYSDMDAGMYKTLNLSGNVWHDVNGMTDNLVNNTGPLQIPPAAVIPTGLRITLVDANTSLVIRTTLVQGNGVFNFVNIIPGNYILVLSPIPGTPGDPSPFASLPSGWINTGEHLGLNPGRDAVINGKLSISITTASVINANFGIKLNNDDIGIN